ncbi:MAG: RNA polymerase sigma factor [Cyclobacteriaceae bacterium]
MLKVKAGDLEKLSLLYQRYSRRMYGFFYRMTTDGATSEDLVQNVFMRMLKYKHTYADDGKFETWAFRLARNVHHDHYKKNKRYLHQEDMTTWEQRMEQSGNVENDWVKSDEMSHLKQALDMLSPEKRELIEMTRFQQMKYADVAAVLGTNEGAVKVRMHRALKSLREVYEKIESRV